MHGFIDGGGDFARGQLGFGRAVRNRFRVGAEIFIVVALALQGRLRDERIALEAQQRALGGIDGNAVEPRVELRLAPELRQRAPGVDEGFLRDVLHQIHIAHHAANQALDAALVLDDQQLVSARLALHGARDQSGVAVVGGRGGFRHGGGRGGRWAQRGQRRAQERAGPGAGAGAGEYSAQRSRRHAAAAALPAPRRRHSQRGGAPARSSRSSKKRWPSSAT